MNRTNAWPWVKGLWSTLLLAGIVTYLFSQRIAGVGVVLEALLLALWSVTSLWTVSRHPQKRPLYAAKLVIWLLSIGVVVAVHFMMAKEARANAHKVIAAVDAYQASHAKYPENVEAIGFTRDDMNSMFGLSGYHSDKDGTVFFYADSFVPYATYNFDFSTRSWEHTD